MPHSRRADFSVAFTCDLFRVEFDEARARNLQYANLVWLQTLLTGMGAWRTFGASSERVVIDLDTPVDQLDSATLIEYQNNSASAWARRYDDPDATAFSPRLQKLLEHDLVIGFELPPTIKRFLNDHGRRYISLCIHPWRFLRDLCFGATTNDRSISARLEHLTIPRDDVDAQVRRFRARFLRRADPVSAIPSGIPVALAQTAADSVLIERGRFLSWRDFPEQIDHALRDHAEVALLQHPYRANANEIVECLRSTHGKTVVATTANSYGVLFSAPDVPLVLSLSSSLGAEAEAIGWPSTFLLADPREKFTVRGVDVASCAPLGHGLLDPGFWRGLLLDEHPSPGLTGWGLGDGHVRNSLESWAFDGLTWSGPLPSPVRKTIVPSASLSPTRLEVLMAEVVGRRGVLPAAAARSLGEAANIALAIDEPPMAVGEDRVCNLATGKPSTSPVDGFHAAEAWGVWSASRSATLTIPLRAEVVNARCKLHIELDVMVFDAGESRTPALRFAYRGRTLAWAFFRSGLMRQTIGCVLVPDAMRCDLSLEMSDVVSPSAVGLSDDVRCLGIGVLGLRCRVELPSEVTGVPSAHDDDAMLLWGIDRDQPLSVTASRAG